jgi:hypothetical protein
MRKIPLIAGLAGVSTWAAPTHPGDPTVMGMIGTFALFGALLMLRLAHLLGVGVDAGQAKRLDFEELLCHYPNGERAPRPSDTSPHEGFGLGARFA